MSDTQSENEIDCELPDVLAGLTRRLHWAITRGGDHPPNDGQLFRERRGQVRTMHVLAEASELTMNDLAVRLQVAPPTVTGLVCGLVEQGYVTRSNDEHDWRVVRVAISESGRQALAQHRHDVLNRVSSWLAELDDDEIDQLNQAIPALRHLSQVLADQHAEKGDARARNS